MPASIGPWARLAAWSMCSAGSTVAGPVLSKATTASPLASPTARSRAACATSGALARATDPNELASTNQKGETAAAASPFLLERPPAHVQNFTDALGDAVLVRLVYSNRLFGVPS